MNQKVKVAIGLGSNIGDRLKFLTEALSRLREDALEESQTSKMYETAPWGLCEQPDFLNCVIVGLSEWKPPSLLNYLKTLER